MGGLRFFLAAVTLPLPLVLFLACREEEPLVYDDKCIVPLDCADETYDCIDGFCVKKTTADQTGNSDSDQSLPEKEAIAETDDNSSTVDDSAAEGEVDADEPPIEEEPDTDTPATEDDTDEDQPVSDDTPYDNPLPDESPDTDDATLTDADTTGIACSSHTDCNQYTEVCYHQQCQSPYRLNYIVKVHEVCLGPKDPTGENWETVPLFDKPDPYAIFNLNGIKVFQTEKGDETFCKTFSTSAQIAFEETDAVSIVVMEYDSGSLSGDRYAGTLNLPNITVKMFRDGEYAESKPGAPLEYIKVTFTPAP